MFRKSKYFQNSNISFLKRKRIIIEFETNIKCKYCGNYLIFREYEDDVPLLCKKCKIASIIPKHKIKKTRKRITFKVVLVKTIQSIITTNKINHEIRIIENLKNRRRK